jgi:hypothetical protein
MMGLLKGRVRDRTFLVFDSADQAEARAFVDYYDHTREVLIYPEPHIVHDAALATSNDPAYILRRVREQHMRDSVVTLVLLGRCTWAARSVDWAMMASLMQHEDAAPNGLFALVLPSAGNSPTLPLRLQANLSSGYARLYPYTFRLGKLASYIRDAARVRSVSADLIDNQSPLQMADLPCP